MKRLLQVLLVLIVIMVAAYFFLVDGIIKSVVEREGSKALKARLDVDGVTFHLFPTSITLHDVEATNPRDPMRNVLEADKISVDVTLAEVLAHKIVAEEVQLHGLRFNQPRSHSGAIPGLTPPPSETKGLAAGLPGINLPDAQQLLAGEKQRVQGELQKIRADLTGLRSDWQQKLKTLPDQAKIDGYKERAQALKHASVLEKVAGADQLRRDLKADLSTTRQLQDQFKQDMQRAQQQLAYAKALPDRELNNLLAGAGVSPGDFNNLTGALLSGQMKPLIDQVLALAGNPLPKIGGTAPATGGGKTQEWLVLARKIILEGQIDLGKHPLRFDGVVNNVTPQPAFWNVPITFTLNGSADQPGKFNATGTLDYRKLPSNSVRINLSQVPIEQLALSTGSDLSIVLNKALAQVQGKLDLTGNQIDFKLNSRFDQAVMNVSAGDNKIAQAIARAVQSISTLDLDLLVSGNVKSPSVNVRSNLDQLLAGAVGQEVKAQAAALGDKLRAQLQEQLGPDLAALQQLEGEVNGLQTLIAQKQESLKALSELRAF